MGQWSEEAKENAAARREIKIEESANVLAQVLQEKGADRPGETIKKRILCPLVAKQIKDNRRHNGVHSIPTVNNQKVKRPDHKFILNNWPDVTAQSADNGSYIIWEPGRGGGCRLGLLEEYQALQGKLHAVTNGLIDNYNERAETINRRGGETPYLDQPLLRIGPPSTQVKV